MYVRVSTEEQVDNYSLETQENLCQKEAEKQGYTITKIFREEGRSPKTITGRPTLINLLTHSFGKRKHIDALFVYRLDRISREAADYLAIRKKLHDYGIKLISTQEPTGEGPSEVFMEIIFAAVAQLDNAIKGERSRNGMYARFKSGLPNAVPLGYLQRDGFVIQDSSVYEIVKLAWDLMATGTKSVPEVAQVLDSQGLKLHGKRPKAKNFYQLFRNKFYCGILASKTYNEEVAGQYDPMISHEQFNKVQKIINKRISKNPSVIRYGHDHPDYPYKRHIRCGKCHHYFTGAWTQGRLKKYPYYMCGIRCMTISINAYKIHEMINILVKSTSLPDKEKISFMNLFRQRAHEKMRRASYRLKSINDSITQLEEKMRIVVDKNVQGIFSDEIYKEQMDMLNKQISILKSERNTTIKYKYDKDTYIFAFEQLLNKFSDTFNAASFFHKKALLHFLFPSGLLWNYDGYLTANPLNAETSIIEQRNKEAFTILVELLENQLLKSNN